MSERITGAEALVRCLEAEGVDTIFGYPGGVALPIFDALFDSKQIRTILPRHEQGAVHAADGYARATGRIAPALVTSGPGATNTVTGLANAYMDSIPMVVFTAQVSHGGPRHGRVPGVRHHRHHAADHQAQLPGEGRRPSCPRSSRRRSTSPRPGVPGPVLIDIPVDVSKGELDFEYPEHGEPARLQAHHQGPRQADQAGRAR